MGKPFFVSNAATKSPSKAGDTKDSKECSTKKSTESCERIMASEMEGVSNGFGASVVLVAARVLLASLVPLVLEWILRGRMKKKDRAKAAPTCEFKKPCPLYSFESLCGLQLANCCISSSR